MEPLQRHSAEWNAFLGELWGIQWTSVYNELTTELNDTMYELSLGNLDMAHRIYREVQRLVISANSDDERVNSVVMEAAYARACGLFSNTEEVKQRRADIVLPSRNHSKSASSRKPKPVISKELIADITRPQHLEFEFQLRELVLAVNLPDRIRDPDLFRQASGHEETLALLRRRGNMCTDPLCELA